MTGKRQEVDNLLRPTLNDIDNNVGCKYNMDHVLPRLMHNIDDCISSCHHSDEQLNFLLLNLHHMSKYRAEKIFPLETQYEILQNHFRGSKHSCHNGVSDTDFIHHDKLFDLLARVGALIREVSTLVQDLEEKSRNEVSTDETSRATRDLLENIELLKEDLKYVYLEAPDSYQCCFPMNDGPLFMHLLHIHLNDLLYSNAYSIALIKEEIALVKEDLEFIRSFYVNVEQRLYKNPWARVLDAAYEAKDIIDSIIVRDNGLLHLIFSLPITIKKIKLIKEEVSSLPEKIPKNKSLVVVNSPKNPVERKTLKTGKIIVGFKEETNWLISQLTSGRKDLDAVSITDISTFVHGAQLTKITTRRRVNGSDLKFSEEIDVADVLRKKLYGKRYLIVLDDVWDITTWDDLTRPFPEAKKGSRILLTTRQKEVAFHGMGNSNPPNLRLLRQIAQNCKGLPLVADLIAGVIAAKGEKLFGRISSSDQSSSSDLMSRRVTIHFDKEHFGPNNFVLLDSKMKRHSGKHLYSLLITGDLRLLRELDLSTSFTRVKDSLLNEIGMLNHLRFLRIGTEVKSLPSSFSNLWNLEILFVTNKGLMMVLLPSIWDLVKLRELSIYACSFFDMDTNEPILIAEDSKLDNLRELGKLVLSYSKDTEDIFKRFSNLQCLSFVLKESWDYSTEQYWFPKLDFLTELEFLKAEFASSNANDSGPSLATNWSWDFHFPSNLKALWLCDFPLSSDSLSTIARLPNLEELFLTRTIRQGEEWNMGEEDTFENLKYLCFEEVDSC
ncbi:hypothetical protein CQW23_13606 [Capsicum baccatum]|uniref:Uncharacterized protein n=1 Tax=Capsicum baccatum TaxID=33114 RepID=A0A2G2WGS1_CAPBA|nr:hypothetical protein CQW23_13606 [Capsicum baccatum]